jgi:hypothetical protein
MSTKTLLGILGGLILIGGLFLPWATLGMLSVSGFNKIGTDAMFLLCLGFLGLCSSISEKSWVMGITTAISILILGGSYASLQENLSNVNLFGISAQIGSGFYISCIGIILLIIATFLKEKKAT